MKYKKLKLTCLLVHIILFNYDCIGTDTQILDQIAAIIDKDIILESDIKNIQTFSNEYYNNNFHTINNNKYLNKQKILTQLITNTLILQLAQHMNINVNQNHINEIIDDITIQNNMTKQQFCSYLKSKNIDYNDYINYIQKDAIINTICNYEMHQRIKIYPNELKNLTKQIIKTNNNTMLQLDHILIPLQYTKNNQIQKIHILGKFLVQEIQHGIPAEQLKTLYSKNTILKNIKINKIDWTPLNELPTLFEENFIKQKEIQVNDVIGPIHSNIGLHILKITGINNNTKKNIITNIHIRHILIKKSNTNNDKVIYTQLLKTIDQIKKHHTTFSIAAQQISDDSHSSTRGGDLGWKSLKDFDKPLQKLLQSIKIGDITPPIKTTYGWHIIQLLNIQRIDKNDFFSQENAYQIIFNKKINDAMKHWTQELKTSTYIKILNNNDKKNTPNYNYTW